MARNLLFAPTSAPLKAEGRYRGLWPAPVYVATFADGTVGRHSFYSPAGKPGLDFERGRTGACWLWRENWPRGNDSRGDLVAGYVEHNGVTYPDLHCREQPSAAKPARDPLAAVLAKIGKLAWADVERLQAAIDQRLAA